MFFVFWFFFKCTLMLPLLLFQVFKSYIFKLFSQILMTGNLAYLFHCLVRLTSRNESCEESWGSLQNTDLCTWDFRKAGNMTMQYNEFSRLQMFHTFRMQNAVLSKAWNKLLYFIDRSSKLLATTQYYFKQRSLFWNTHKKLKH